MKYDIDGHIWWAPTRKPGGWIFNKSSPAPAPAPDPTTVSNAQTASNVQTAAATAALNRVNQYTPYGNLTYSNTPGAFDNAGYSSAVNDYNAKAQQYANATPNSGLTFDNGQLGGNTDALKALTGAIGAGPDKSAFQGQDQWSSNVSLSPDQQKLLQSNNAISQQLADTAQSGLARVTDSMGKPFDTSQLTNYGAVPTGGGAQAYNPTAGNYTTGLNGGAIQNSLGDLSSDAAVQRTIDAVNSRVVPQLQRDQTALDTKLSNQGIPLGSKAYETAQTLQGQRANDAYQQSVLAGNQEQNVLFNQGLQSGQFANSAQAQDFSQQAQNAALNNSVQDTQFNQGLATNQNNNAVQAQNFGQQSTASQLADQQRQQQIQEQAYLRSLPLNELNALRTGSQVQNPQFGAVPGATVNPTNTGSNVFQAYGLGQQNASNQTAQNNSLNSGLFTLGAAAIAASDRRLKTNIERIGTYRGIGVYTYDYLWGGPKQTGLMADEVETIAPEAVSTHPRGYKYVDYSKV